MAVTKAVEYKQSNRLTKGVFHRFLILRLLLLGVPRIVGQDCSYTIQSRLQYTLSLHAFISQISFHVSTMFHLSNTSVCCRKL